MSFDPSVLPPISGHRPRMIGHILLHIEKPFELPADSEILQISLMPHIESVSIVYTYPA